MADCYDEALIAEIRAHGVKTWRIDKAGRAHPRLMFEFAGRPLMYVMPNTPSDKHGVLNALSDLRRLMGVKRIIRKKGRV